MSIPNSQSVPPSHQHFPTGNNKFVFYVCESFLFCKQVHLYPGDYHAMWSKSDRERQMSCDITYMQNLKKKRYKWTCLQSRNKLTDLVMQKSHTGKFEDTNERSLIHTASSNQSPILIFTPLNLSALACWAHSVPNIARDPGKNSPHPQ